ncbi:hypothetical protein FI667_g8011, partial [Globisporangium splendens]
MTNMISSFFFVSGVVRLKCRSKAPPSGPTQQQGGSRKTRRTRIHNPQLTLAYTDTPTHWPMTTLHRKPRGDARYFHTAVDINEVDAVDSSSKTSESSRQVYRNNSSNSSPGSSKGRRSSKYIRRGLYSSSSGSSYSGGGASLSSSSKKMSTLQLRTFFVVCVLLYFCALFFAQEIVSFGKFVNSEQTRQKIFSQWKPMHSAASQYLRAAMTDPEVVNGEKRDADFVKAADVSELPKENEEKSVDVEAAAEERDVPPPASHQVDASVSPALHEPSLNPPQEAPPTVQTEDEEHGKPEQEKAAETHEQGVRAPPPVSVTPDHHQDAEDDNRAAAMMAENWSQAPRDAENRHGEPDQLSMKPLPKDEAANADHPVTESLVREADEPAVLRKTDRDGEDSTTALANNVESSIIPPMVNRNEKDAVVREAEAEPRLHEGQHVPTDTAAAAAAVPSFAHTDEALSSEPPLGPISSDDASAAPLGVGRDEGAADAIKESEEQVAAPETRAAVTAANEEEDGGDETQDGFHHHHLDEAR